MGAIHLIRHGQASWGAEDYDQLSERGVEQSALLGTAWEASAWVPTSAVAGGMKRHAQTAVATIDASGAETGAGQGWDVDGGWDEYDHRALTGGLAAAPGTVTPREFQPMLESALADWMAGGGTDGQVAYADWRAGVLSSFAAAVAAAGSGRAVAVFTSGGPIATVVSHLLAGDDSLFIGLNAVAVNTGVTTVMVGSTGPRVLSFNEHGHLPRDLVTFR